MQAGEVMDRAASLLNDTAKGVYTYTVQLPYLNMAIDELSGTLEANNIPYTNKESADLKIAIGVTSIDSSTTPALPSDLVEIQAVKEREYDSDEPYQEMKRVDFLPEFEQQQTLVYFSWQGQALKFIGATTDREIQIEYIASMIASATSSTSNIALINAKNYLAFRTAALCAMYIGENPTRAAALDKDSEGQLDWLLRISIKGSQVIPTRRRPFMAGFKARGW
jgi:hypothetical protein